MLRRRLLLLSLVWWLVVALPASCAKPKPAAVTPSATPPAAAPASTAAPAATAEAARPSIPDRLSDAEFWNLVSDFSEPNGFFRSDNLLSNEVWMQYVIPELLDIARPGRVYMGVGPEQNFTYITAVKPSMAFIVDVRRGNLNLQLMYKALFELSTDRVDFVSRLFSRPRPDGLNEHSTVADIFSAYWPTQSSDELFTTNLDAIVTHLSKTHGFALSADDIENIKNVYAQFETAGPALTYSMGGRGGRNFPTYADLMVATDEGGTTRSFLATEENFAFIKSLEARNLLVPIVGNFAGPKAVRSVGAYVRAHNSIIQTFYLSNVEQYLTMDGIWLDFCRNVATLPVDETSRFIRSVRNTQFGFPGGLTNQLGVMAEEVKANGCGM
jgi:hypothetical protein